MPTYDYRCRQCKHEDSVIQSITQYINDPLVPKCPAHQDSMERKLSVVPAFSGLANALAGDRHYDGLRAPDGTDISSRTKHREYMARTGLTTADDYTQSWKRAEDERTALRTATFQDKELRADLTQQVMTQVAQPD